MLPDRLAPTRLPGRLTQARSIFLSVEMIPGVKQIVPKELHPFLRPTYQHMRRWLAKLDCACDRRTMSLSEFAQLLEELGITSGATVMIHSSMDEIGRRVPDLNSIKLIQLMQQLLGREGTLLMPTFPFLGLQLHYVETHDTFDARQTPSQVGLATEVFRRMPGVVRSLHPTHSIAGWGKHARDLLATHHLGATFGPDSPMYKLQEYGGLVAGLGTGLNRFTILHVAEELHHETRESRFEAEPRVMTIIDGPKRIPYTFKVLKAGVEYDFDRIARSLSKDGTLKRVSKSGLKCVAARADHLIKHSLELVERHAYFASTWSLQGWRRPY
jgi:aminoglycoside N3'-acetyltransferase